MEGEEFSEVTSRHGKVKLESGAPQTLRHSAFWFIQSVNFWKAEKRSQLVALPAPGFSLLCSRKCTRHTQGAPWPCQGQARCLDLGGLPGGPEPSEPLPSEPLAASLWLPAAAAGARTTS